MIEIPDLIYPKSLNYNGYVMREWRAYAVCGSCWRDPNGGLTQCRCQAWPIPFMETRSSALTIRAARHRSRALPPE